MSNKDAQEATQRTDALAQTFIAYRFEEEALKEVNRQKMKVEKARGESSSSNNNNNNNKAIIVENDGVFVEDKDESVGSAIKTEAINLRPSYHSLGAGEKAIVALGLNSVLDVSVEHPNCQAMIFSSQQWAELRERFACSKYDDGQYDDIRKKLVCANKIYSSNRTTEVNWLALYKLLKAMAMENDPLLEPECIDFSFCVDLLIKVLTIIKTQPELFDEQVDCSEWDFVVKFWGPVLEKLFEKSDLRLKWGDTTLALHHTVTDAVFKVDMRVINDKIVQRYNVESDVSVMEAAEEDPNANKFISDRCKLAIESKSVVDKYLLDGVDISSVDSLQICGLQLFFVSTSLQAKGLYISDELAHHSITKSLRDVEKLVDLAIDLLCFRDRCVAISNQHITCITEKRDKVRKSKTKKRTANDLDDESLTVKQESIRGTWNPPRTNKTTIPNPPSNLSA